MIHPLRAYGEGLRRASGPASRGSGPLLRLRDGTALAVPFDRYLAPADEIDEHVLCDLQGPVLDVGCGPGRHLHALAARGVFALGVDLSPAAVELATDRGARAVVASIFDELPGGGSWRSALLLDGNIGIGGSPARLLARIGSLLCADGVLLVELGAPDTPTQSTLVRIETEHQVSSWFPWARVSVREVDALARSAGFRTRGRLALGGRWFARLRSDTMRRGAHESLLNGRAAGRATPRPRRGALPVSRRESSAPRALRARAGAGPGSGP
jgi:SAM-dependent methyltransferase